MPDRVHVHLVRHGEVENPEAVRYGHLEGFSLSAKGREQVQRAAAWLAAYTPHAGSIATSPLERARETADVIAARLAIDPIVVDARLTEAASRFDGLPRRIAPLRYARRHFETLSSHVRETPVAIARRMRDAVFDHCDRVRDANADAIVLVSHQLPIQYLRHSFERGGLDVRDLFTWARFQLGMAAKPPCAPASVTTLVFEARSLIDVRYSEAL